MRTDKLVLTVGTLALFIVVSAVAQSLLPALAQPTSEGVGAINEIKNFLSLVNDEYAVAVKDGQVIEQEEYDESLSFLSNATEEFNANKAEFAIVAAEETTEVEEEMDRLASLIENKADPVQVSDSIKLIENELDAISESLNGNGAQESEGTVDGWGYIAKINELLDKTVADYKNGAYDEARTAARSAYLDNYENIESDIAEENRELMGKIEAAMRVDLIKMIDDRRPAAEIESQVQMIKTDLETAQAIVTPEFPVGAIIAMASVIAAVVAVSRFRGYIWKKGGASSI